MKTGRGASGRSPVSTGKESSEVVGPALRKKVYLDLPLQGVSIAGNLSRLVMDIPGSRSYVTLKGHSLR